MNIGQKLLQLRNEKGWSQEYVGHKLGGLSQSAISKLENNEYTSSLKQLELAGELFEMDASEFLKNESSPTQINNNQSGGNAVNYLLQTTEQLEAAHQEAIEAKNETIRTQIALLHELSMQLAELKGKI